MIPGFKFLIFGPAGSGKTYSTRTLFDIEGIQPIHLFLEASMTTITSLPNAKWKHITPFPKTIGLKALRQVALASNTLGHGELQNAGVGERRKFTTWFEIIDTLNKFTTKSGEELGDVESWGTDKVLVIDGLTGLCTAARMLRSGLTPLPPQSDYGVIQSNVRFLLQWLVDNLQCHFVLIAHIDKELDHINGGYTKTVRAIGKQLAPDVPQLFDDVVISVKSGANFIWTTAEDNSETKNRNLPLSEKLEQNFQLLFDAWKKNGGVVDGMDGKTG